MIGPKPFLIGMFICGALLLFHVQPSFGIRGHGHEQHSGGESESEPKGIEHLPDDKPGQKEEKEHGHGHHSATEQKGEQPKATETEDSETQREAENKDSEKLKEGKENQHSSGIGGGKLDGKKMFNEVVEKDIAQLKEYLKKHEARQGNEDSDPKKIIENMMEHLKNTEIKCANDNDEEDDKQQPPQYDLKCNHFVEIHKYLLNWLNFLANREEIDKQDYKYLAVRPVVKKQEKGSPEWKEVELKELLDVFKELEKDEPKEVYSFDNLPECHFIKTLVKNLEHGNAKEIKKVKEEIKEIWEKEKDVLCGKGEVFKEEKHNKNLAKHIKEHNKTALVHLIGSPSRLDREMKKGAAEKEKNKGKSAEGNSELEIKGEDEIQESKEEKLNKKNGEHEKNKKNEEEVEMKEKEEDKEGVGKKVEASESEAASAGSEAVEHPKKVKGAGPEPANGHGHGRTHH